MSTRFTKTGRPSAGQPDASRSSQFIPEIHGMRGLALVLVVLFHLFGNGRVSGGIDVFLFITGFLFTRSFARQIAQTGKLNLQRHFARTAFRILPAALLTILCVAIGIVLLIPESEWTTLFPQVTASALYYENWQLIASAMDYGAAGSGASPLQHFWSLSIQGQFYLLFPFVVLAVAWTARRIQGRPRRALAIILAISTLASFVFAWHLHLASQPVAYFSSFTRFWELGVGGLLAFMLPRLPVPNHLRLWSGWIGLALVATCGFVLDGAALFPGPAALWPIVGIGLVILGSGGSGRWPVRSLLLFRPLRFAADISYPLYLWHWPLAVFFLAYRGHEHLSVRSGLLILAISILIAWTTQRLIAAPAMSFVSHAPYSRCLVVTATTLALVAGVGFGTVTGLNERHEAEIKTLAAAQDTELEQPETDLARPLVTESPKASNPATGISPSPSTTSTAMTKDEFAKLTSYKKLSDIKPPVAVARDDRPIVYRKEGCVQWWAGKGTEPAFVCTELKGKKGRHRIVVAGGSHTLQWYTPLRKLAKQQGWELITVAKDGCHFTTAPKREGKEDATCVPWNKNALKKILELKPDAVFTVGTRTRWNGPEYIHDADFALWKILESHSIPMILIRDTPRFKSYRPACVAKSNGNPLKCARPQNEVMAPVNPLVTRTDLPAHTTVVDLTDHICFLGTCPVVFDNMFVYRDDTHISDTYARALAADLTTSMRRVAPRLFQNHGE